MVDFGKLRTEKQKPKPILPYDIFRRLPKPEGINDLYASQIDVLNDWFNRRSERDVVLKLHTGGGKTMVGLLLAQSTMNETGGSVLYLAPTVQLVKQTLTKATELGIAAVPYTKRVELDERFVNGSALMVGTYNALFNGLSKFKIRGGGTPQEVEAIILDDAHVAFSVIRDAFTLSVSRDNDREIYESLTSLFRSSFSESDRLTMSSLETITPSSRSRIGRGIRELRTCVRFFVPSLKSLPFSGHCCVTSCTSVMH
ncbi:DEAD/DEAH box helicase [Novipirellula rosea]|uniref:DEAD/DEAH box helicase n=1 Tax=Novipirellula rosea TaxID=1031540 RepID=UPI0031EF980B